MYAANRIAHGKCTSDESSMDPPSDASIGELLFGMKSDCGSIASTSSNVSIKDITKATSLIDLTHPDKIDDSESADDDTSPSRQVTGNTTISKNILKSLKDIRGLIKCHITHEIMQDPLMGTDRTSYERECISQWLREISKSPTSREPVQMHCLIPDFTMRRILSALEDNKITEEFIDDMSKASSVTTEKSKQQLLLYQSTLHQLNQFALHPFKKMNKERLFLIRWRLIR